MPTLKTFEDAVAFVREHTIITVFGSKGSPHPSLWDNTALSATKPKAGGWSPRVIAVWDWKTRIPQTFPDDIFYGKLPDGDAMLMRMDYLRDVHYPQAHLPIRELSPLAQEVYEIIRVEPNYTGPLRKQAIAVTGTTKSRFDTALKQLQCTLNIVRSMDPDHDGDFWLPFSDVHLDIVERWEDADRGL